MRSHEKQSELPQQQTSTIGGSANATQQSMNDHEELRRVLNELESHGYGLGGSRTVGNALEDNLSRDMHSLCKQVLEDGQASSTSRSQQHERPSTQPLVDMTEARRAARPTSSTEEISNAGSVARIVQFSNDNPLYCNIGPPRYCRPLRASTSDQEEALRPQFPVSLPSLIKGTASLMTRTADHQTLEEDTARGPNGSKQITTASLRSTYYEDFMVQRRYHDKR